MRVCQPVDLYGPSTAFDVDRRNRFQLLPMMRKEFLNATGGLRRQPREDVADAGVGVMPVLLARAAGIEVVWPDACNGASSMRC
mgnify:CR=1 FL=1